MSNLTGWHRGERIARQKLGYDKIPSTAHAFSWISGEMPDQHSQFYTTRLQFLPICTLDETGRPWSSLVTGKDARRGFVRHPHYNTLAIDAHLRKGDPLLKNVHQIGKGDGMLIAGVGVELSTRRRNKFAGEVSRLDLIENDAYIELVVNEAIGNCPKYITLRELEPIPKPDPVVVEDQFKLSSSDRLPPDAISLILSSDIVFFGTTYSALESESQAYPSHLGLNHRGGAPGFIRVKLDGRTVVLPDFSGNRILTSLGNVEATPLAGLTFVSFLSGDILYITGTAQNLYGDDSRKVMPFQDTITEVYITGFTYVRQGFPLRETSEQKIQLSPYNPPVRLLAEEDQSSTLFSSQNLPKLLLNRITLHSPTVATFEWDVSTPIQILPGQAAILDFKPLLGSRQYQHMSPSRPSLVNDDFIRTWTVSSASDSDEATTQSFSLTMREKPGGVVTGALFSLARKLAEGKPEMLDNVRGLELKVDLVGITGEFVLPKNVTSSSSATPSLLWIAGGIGVTPFIAMLSRLAASGNEFPWNITLLLSARDPDVMLALVADAVQNLDLQNATSLSIHLYSTSTTAFNSELQVTKHDGRINEADIGGILSNMPPGDVEVFLCGPDSFAKSLRAPTGSMGAVIRKVHHEGFAY
ncbi:hypothetical protein CPB83DRAFT_909061 [Crepidotus variabilis]|uniref:FAD-binding FR-type domain-containing protein n=1 Tax=Crepidotus variabilis TaxID=179855 RepID=A0A9P6JME4_9AGAR|nr:hypothetical protein CPB83DRAFT_909061 [Crepidotus variabilis]